MKHHSGTAWQLGRGWAGAAGELGELFSPHFCVVCRVSGVDMLGQKALCPVCEKLLGLSTLNVRITSLPYAPCTVATAGEYEYELARCLLAFKNSARTDLRPYLGVALTRSLSFLCDGLIRNGNLHRGSRVYLIPIPSSRASLRRRGYEPAPEITRAARPSLQKLYPELRFTVIEALRPLYPGERGIGLMGVKRSSQKQLGQQDRYRKMHKSLTVRQPFLHWAGRYLDLTGSLCILCDDVATTGASLAEATRVLTQAGANVLGASAVARVVRRDGLPVSLEDRLGPEI